MVEGQSCLRLVRSTSTKRKSRSRSRSHSPRSWRGKRKVAPEEIEEVRKIQSTMRRLPPVDLAAVKEPCALLHLSSSYLPGQYTAMAWFPERHVALVSNTRVTRSHYIRVASSGGLLCGLHQRNMFDYSDSADWRLKLAVFNPSSGRDERLPELMPRRSHRGASPGTAYEYGLLQVRMDHAAGGKFRVHVLMHGVGDRTFTVYTYQRGARRWVSSSSEPDNSAQDRVTDDRLVGELVFRLINLHAYDVETRAWTSVPRPGKSWNDYPIPEEILAINPVYRYWRLDPFRYRGRLLMAGICSLRPQEGDEFGVILEDLTHGSKVGSWSIVAWTRCQSVNGTCLSGPREDVRVPQVCGKLLVFPPHAFSAPTAFHLEDNAWYNLPPDVMQLPLQVSCPFNP